MLYLFDFYFNIYLIYLYYIRRFEFFFFFRVLTPLSPPQVTGCVFKVCLQDLTPVSTLLALVVTAGLDSGFLVTLMKRCEGAGCSWMVASTVRMLGRCLCDPLNRGQRHMHTALSHGKGGPAGSRELSFFFFFFFLNLLESCPSEAQCLKLCFLPAPQAIVSSLKWGSSLDHFIWLLRAIITGKAVQNGISVRKDSNTPASSHLAF